MPRGAGGRGQAQDFEPEQGSSRWVFNFGAGRGAYLISKKGVPAFDVLVKRPVGRGRVLKVIGVKAVNDLERLICKKRFCKSVT